MMLTDSHIALLRQLAAQAVRAHLDEKKNQHPYGSAPQKLPTGQKTAPENAHTERRLNHD